MFAYVLVQTDVGVIGDVTGEIADVKGVLSAEAVAGPTTSSPGPRRTASTSSAG